MTTTLEAMQRLLPQRGNTCAACGRHVEPAAPNVNLRGTWFHAACAVYRPRRRVAPAPPAP